MSDQELKVLAQDLKDLLLGQTQTIRCNLQSDVVVEHTKILTTLQSDVSHILAGIVDINNKLERQTENHNENSEKITEVSSRVKTLEENKKSIISTICLIGIIAYEFGKEILLKKL